MFKRSIIYIVLITFVLSLYAPYQQSWAGESMTLPKPGTMINLSPAFDPVLIKGLKIDPKKPFSFEFVLDIGDSHPEQSEGSQKKDSSASKNMTHQNDFRDDKYLKQESTRLIKYFLASLTIPEKDLWVNLSPYEKDRMIASNLAQTEMGRDMLAQDYILKQLTASLIYPEKDLGKAFWDKVYAKAQALYGNTNIPVNTFNKVWIVADRADVFEKGNVAYVVGAHLKVMLAEDYEASAKSRQNRDFGGLEEDYLSIQKHENVGVAEAGAPHRAQFMSTMGKAAGQDPNIHRLGSGRLQINKGLNLKATQSQKPNALGNEIIREIVLPALEQEVNTGRNFAPLRQMFYSMILASWYKMALKESIIAQVYSNQSKVKGLSYMNVRNTNIRISETRSNVQIYKLSKRFGNLKFDDLKFISNIRSFENSNISPEHIYQNYLLAYKKGVFNYIKEDINQSTHQRIPRKYFSGGLEVFPGGDAAQVVRRLRNIPPGTSFSDNAAIAKVDVDFSQNSERRVTDSNVQQSFYNRNFTNDLVTDDNVALSLVSISPEFRNSYVDVLMKEIKPGQRVLSVGEGQGHLAQELIKRGVIISAIDISDENTKKAKEKGVDQIQGDATQLEEIYKDQQPFDVVLFSESIGGMPIETVLKQAYKVLKSEGKLIVSTYPQTFRSQVNYVKRIFIDYSIEKIKREIFSAGFSFNSLKSIYSGLINLGRSQKVHSELNVYVATKSKYERELKLVSDDKAMVIGDKNNNEFLQDWDPETQPLWITVDNPKDPAHHLELFIQFKENKSIEITIYDGLRRLGMIEAKETHDSIKLSYFAPFDTLDLIAEFEGKNYSQIFVSVLARIAQKRHKQLFDEGTHNALLLAALQRNISKENFQKNGRTNMEWEKFYDSNQVGFISFAPVWDYEGLKFFLNFVGQGQYEISRVLNFNGDLPPKSDSIRVKVSPKGIVEPLTHQDHELFKNGPLQIKSFQEFVSVRGNPKPIPIQFRASFSRISNSNIVQQDSSNFDQGTKRKSHNSIDWVEGYPSRDHFYNGKAIVVMSTTNPRNGSLVDVVFIPVEQKIVIFIDHQRNGTIDFLTGPDMRDWRIKNFYPLGPGNAVQGTGIAILIDAAIALVTSQYGHTLQNSMTDNIAVAKAHFLAFAQQYLDPTTNKWLNIAEGESFDPSNLRTKVRGEPRDLGIPFKTRYTTINLTDFLQTSEYQQGLFDVDLGMESEISEQPKVWQNQWPSIEDLQHSRGVLKLTIRHSTDGYQLEMKLRPFTHTIEIYINNQRTGSVDLNIYSDIWQIKSFFPKEEQSSLRIRGISRLIVGGIAIMASQYGHKLQNFKATNKSLARAFWEGFGDEYYDFNTQKWVSINGDGFKEMKSYRLRGNPKVFSDLNYDISFEQDVDGAMNASEVGRILTESLIQERVQKIKGSIPDIARQLVYNPRLKQLILNGQKIDFVGQGSLNKVFKLEIDGIAIALRIFDPSENIQYAEVKPFKGFHRSAELGGILPIAEGQTSNGYHFMAVDFIDGESLNKVSKLVESDVVELINLIDKMIDNFVSINDFLPEQLMLGRSSLTNERKMWLVDAEEMTDNLQIIKNTIGIPQDKIEQFALRKTVNMFLYLIQNDTKGKFNWDKFPEVKKRLIDHLTSRLASSGQPIVKTPSVLLSDGEREAQGVVLKLRSKFKSMGITLPGIDYKTTFIQQRNIKDLKWYLFEMVSFNNAPRYLEIFVKDDEAVAYGDVTLSGITAMLGFSSLLKNIKMSAYWKDIFTQRVQSLHEAILQQRGIREIIIPTDQLISEHILMLRAAHYLGGIDENNAKQVQNLINKVQNGEKLNDEEEKMVNAIPAGNYSFGLAVDFYVNKLGLRHVELAKPEFHLPPLRKDLFDRLVGIQDQEGKHLSELELVELFAGRVLRENLESFLTANIVQSYPKDKALITIKPSNNQVKLGDNAVISKDDMTPVASAKTMFEWPTIKDLQHGKKEVTLTVRHPTEGYLLEMKLKPLINILEIYINGQRTGSVQFNIHQEVWRISGFYPKRRNPQLQIRGLSRLIVGGMVLIASHYGRKLENYKAFNKSLARAFWEGFGDEYYDFINNKWMKINGQEFIKDKYQYRIIGNPRKFNDLKYDVFWGPLQQDNAVITKVDVTRVKTNERIKSLLIDLASPFQRRRAESRQQLVEMAAKQREIVQALVRNFIDPIGIKEASDAFEMNKMVMATTEFLPNYARRLARFTSLYGIKQIIENSSEPIQEELINRLNDEAKAWLKDPPELKKEFALIELSNLGHEVKPEIISPAYALLETLRLISLSSKDNNREPLPSWIIDSIHIIVPFDKLNQTARELIYLIDDNEHKPEELKGRTMSKSLRIDGARDTVTKIPSEILGELANPNQLIRANARETIVKSVLDYRIKVNELLDNMVMPIGLDSAKKEYQDINKGSNRGFLKRYTIRKARDTTLYTIFEIYEKLKESTKVQVRQIIMDRLNLEVQEWLKAHQLEENDARLTQVTEKEKSLIQKSNLGHSYSKKGLSYALLDLFRLYSISIKMKLIPRVNNANTHDSKTVPFYPWLVQTFNELVGEVEQMPAILEKIILLQDQAMDSSPQQHRPRYERDENGKQSISKEAYNLALNFLDGDLRTINDIDTRAEELISDGTITLSDLPYIEEILLNKNVRLYAKAREGCLFVLSYLIKESNLKDNWWGNIVKHAFTPRISEFLGVEENGFVREAAILSLIRIDTQKAIKYVHKALFLNIEPSHELRMKIIEMIHQYEELKINPVILKQLVYLRDHDKDRRVRSLVEKVLNSLPKGTDLAMINPGGIDLDASKINMNVSKESQKGILAIDQALIARIRQSGFEGFNFDVKSITPIDNLPQYLGINTN